MEHGIHRLVSFAELGHKPVKRLRIACTVFEAEVDWCAECECTADSQMGHMPCGDIFGTTATVRASIRDGGPAWDYWWQGRVIGWVRRKPQPWDWTETKQTT